MAARFFTLDPPLAPPTTAFSTVAQVRTSTRAAPSTNFPSDLVAVGTATITQSFLCLRASWKRAGDQNLPRYKDRVYVSFFRPTADSTVVSTRGTLTYPYPTTNPICAA